MKRLRFPTALLHRFADDTNGTTAIEYALIAAGISVAIVATVTLIGTRVGDLFESVQAAWPA